MHIILLPAIKSYLADIVYNTLSAIIFTKLTLYFYNKYYIR